MKRERLVWLCSLLLVSLAALRAPLAAQRDGDYLFVRTLVDVNRLVVNNYVEKADPRDLEQAAINGMLEQLDPFTVYVPPAQRQQFDNALEGTFRGIGIQLEQLPSGAVEVVTPIEGSPAFRAGVMAGDVILKVNGQSIEGLRLPDVIQRIGGDQGTAVTLTLRRTTGQVLELTMKREDIVVPTVKGFSRKPDNTWNYYATTEPKIAYIRLTQFTSTSYDALRTALNELIRDGMAGLILDLRWNPGGSLDQAVQIVDMLVPSGVIVSTRGLHRAEEVRRASGAGTLPYFPMIVLINEHTASAAEIVAGSLLDNRRAVVIGTRSYGKGSVQEVIPLEGNNGELKLTVAYYYLPSGRLVHRRKDATDWGVEPQITVPLDDETQRKIFEQQRQAELMLRPTTNGTAPATRPVVDPQLQRALDTMLLTTLMQAPGRGPATGPATRPGDRGR